jgi:hypothetical protein
MKPNDDLKRQAMSAIANVQTTVAQIGLAKLTAGAAVYAAHIRQMDRQAPPRQRQVRRDAIGREV